MNGFSLNGLLAVAQIFGFLWIALLFLLCFFAVHAAKLIRVGWAQYKKEDAPQKSEKTEKVEEKKAPEQREPIYYIVERKRRRTKPASYGEPKQISFK